MPEELPALLDADDGALLDRWVALQTSADTLRPDLIDENELREQSRRFLRLLSAAVAQSPDSTRGPEWDDTRAMLGELSTTRSRQGFSPTETATFVFSLKQPLFELLGSSDAMWRASMLLDELGLHTTEVFLTAREDVIRRQQDELLELSTPVMQVWDGMLVLPLVGTVDSARAQVVMETLLNEIVATKSTTAILDITGVPTVDTLVAQHLLKTAGAARLMGAECVISGIRPTIAQTIVQLGLDLSSVPTRATLADALRYALARGSAPAPALGATSESVLGGMLAGSPSNGET